MREITASLISIIGEQCVDHRLTGIGARLRQINYLRKLARTADRDDMLAILGRIMVIFFSGETFHGWVSTGAAFAVRQSPVFPGAERSPVSESLPASIEEMSDRSNFTGLVEMSDDIAGKRWILASAV